MLLEARGVEAAATDAEAALPFADGVQSYGCA